VEEREGLEEESGRSGDWGRSQGRTTEEGEGEVEEERSEEVTTIPHAATTAFLKSFLFRGLYRVNEHSPAFLLKSSGSVSFVTDLNSSTFILFSARLCSSPVAAASSSFATNTELLTNHIVLCVTEGCPLDDEEDDDDEDDNEEIAEREGDEEEDEEEADDEEEEEEEGESRERKSRA